MEKAWSLFKILGDKLCFLLKWSFTECAIANDLAYSGYSILGSILVSVESLNS